MNWPRVAWKLCAALSVVHVVGFLTVALLRWRYPYDLEWMEGGQLVQSYEILAGRFPYRAPSADYIAFPYQPLYAAVVAALGWVFGLSLPLARAVSIASTLACAGLVGRIVWRETGDRAYGLLAAAMVLALYRVVGFWFDLARVDSLFMALLVAALYAGRYIEGAWRSCLTSAALFVLAYKTKQLALPFCILVPALLASKSRRAAWAFVPLVFLPLAVDFWLSQRASGGWFSFYVNEVPRAQPYQLSRLMRFPWVVAVQIPVIVGLAAADALHNVRERPWRANLSDVWTLAMIVGATVTVAAWARPGGYANNMMTMYIFAVIPGFVALHRMASQGASQRQLLLFSALAAQLLWLRYDPMRQIPGPLDYEAGARFVDEIRAIDGPVLVPQRPWIAALAGKAPSYHANAYWERGFMHRTDRVPDDLLRRLDTGFYRLIAVDTDPRAVAETERVVPDEMDRSYVCDRTLALPGRGLDAIAGAPEPGPRLLCRYAPR